MPECIKSEAIDILFLDINGVLNRAGTTERCGPYVGIDRELSERLLAWLRTTNIKIVLSTSWRYQQDACDHLCQAGIEWIGVTPRAWRNFRGDEIQEWLDDNRGKWWRYAILDDSGDFHRAQFKRLVRTNEVHGVLPNHIDRLKKLFEG